MYGYNTDYTGFAYLARCHGVKFAGAVVLVLGTGGTHNTVTAVCQDAGAKQVLTASRTGKDGALTYEEAQQHPEINIIINTTPAGMYPNNGSCLLDLHTFPKLEAVLDAAPALYLPAPGGILPGCFRSPGSAAPTGVLCPADGA